MPRAGAAFADTEAVMVLNILGLITSIFVLTAFQPKAYAALTVFGKLPPEVEKILQCQDLLGNTKTKAKPTKKAKSKPRKATTAELPTATLWFTALELGDYDMWVQRDPRTGIRRALRGTFISGGQKFVHDFSKMLFLFMPDAQDNQAAYYAQIRHDPAIDNFEIELHSLDARKEMDAAINESLELVWKVYKEQGTVTDKEIREFKEQEKKLDPQRKITFATKESIENETLSVMRVYDGSPFPGIYFVDFGEHFDYKGKTDPRVPVERRYPKINFRAETEYVFEAGRLAKDARETDALQRLNKHFAHLLSTKYGYSGIVPKDYLQGRVYIEITGKNLSFYLNPRSKGGLGFKKFYEPPVKSGEPAKYVLYTTVEEFIKTFTDGKVKIKRNSAYAQITVTP